MMKLRPLTFLLMLLLPVSLSRGDETVPLPTDPAIPVVEMWYVDGGDLREPEVTVFAGGRVRIRVGDGAIWGELEPPQVQRLVHLLLTRDRLSSLTTEQIAQALETASRQTGLSTEIAGAADTIIRVRTADKTFRIDGHAVGLLASRFPDVLPVQQFYGAQQRLENLRAVMMVGGIPAAERLARLAESQIHAESGERIPVRPEDLSCVHALTDGTRCCQFLIRDQRHPHAEPRIVSLFESPGEIPRVSVLPDGSSLQ